MDHEIVFEGDNASGPVVRVGASIPGFPPFIPLECRRTWRRCTTAESISRSPWVSTNRDVPSLSLHLAVLATTRRRDVRES